MSGLLYEDAARAALRRGVAAVADAARVTLGPRGRLVVLGGGTGPGSAGSRSGGSGAGPDRSGAGAGGAGSRGGGGGAGGAGGGAGAASGPVATRDGATVAGAVRLSDPYANLGASLVREAATRTRRAVGDGTTTTIVLAQALFAAGLRAVTAGADPVAVRRGIDAAADAAVAHLTATARPLSGERDTARVAAAAARDPELGELVAGAFAKAGRNAAISVEEAHVAGVELEFTEGLRLDRGFLSPFMMTHPEQGTAVLEDPYILLHHGRVAGPADLLPVMERVAATGRPLLVVADSVQQDALAALVANRLRGTLLCAAVPAPALGARRLAHLEDLAALTGAEVVLPEKGMLLRGVELPSLGRAERVVVTRRTTTVTRGAGDAGAVARRVAHLEYALAGAESDFDREVLELRLARLTGGVAVLRVGGATDPERAERRERVAGAVAAVRAALAEGVTPGGGTGLAGARAAVDELLAGGTGPATGSTAGPATATAGSDGAGADTRPPAPLSPDERAGALAVRAALTAPLRQLADNAGADGARVVAETAGLPPGHGWNADTGTYGDLPAAGVLDPVRVPRTALQNAASVAGLMLTAGALVVNRAPRDPDAISWRRRGHGHHHGKGRHHGHHH